VLFIVVIPVLFCVLILGPLSLRARPLLLKPESQRMRRV